MQVSASKLGKIILCAGHSGKKKKKDCLEGGGLSTHFLGETLICLSQRNQPCLLACSPVTRGGDSATVL